MSDSENGLVHVVNTASLTVEYSFPTQPDPVDMLLVPGLHRIFLSHSQGMITVIDTETGYPTEVFWRVRPLTASASHRTPHLSAPRIMEAHRNP